MTVKLYTSKAWLELQVYRMKKTPKDIAQDLGVSHKTIYNWCERHNIKT